MATFYNIYEDYMFFMFVAAVVICFINGTTLTRLREKGKLHYRSWLLPGFIGNILVVVLTFFVLIRLLMRIRSPLLNYLELAINGSVGLLALYTAFRLWQSVNRTAPYPGNLPPYSQHEEAGVWPPSPKPPDKG